MNAIKKRVEGGIEYFKSGAIRSDLVAGVITGVVLVPQSMSYSLLANLPPQYGIYSTISLVVYAFLGSSSMLSVAPVAMASLLVGGYTMTMETTEEAVQAASVIAFYSGLFQVIFGLTRMGTLFSTWLSKTMLLGYTTGVSFTIIISQLPSAFGVSIPKAEQTQFPIYNLGLFLSKLGETKPIAFGFFIVSLLVLYGSQKYLKPWLRPARRFIADLMVLITLVVGTVISFLIIEFAGVVPGKELAIVGTVPTGFPPPTVPNVSTLSEPGLIGTSIAIAIVAFSEGFSVATSLPKANVNANREFFAVGCCNLVSSFFNGFVVSGGLSRTMVNVNAGAKSQMSSIVSFAVSLLAIFVVAPAIKFIPKSLLAAIIVVAVLGMIKTVGLYQTWRVSKLDFAVAMSTTVIIVCIGAMYGIAYGVVVSVAVNTYRIAIPHIAELGQMRNGMLRNLKRYPNEAARIRGVRVIRLDSPLFFANASTFFAKCKEVVATPEEGEVIRAFLVDASAIGFVDMASLHELLKFQQYLDHMDIHLVLAEVRGPVRDSIDRFNKASRDQIAPFYEYLPDALVLPPQEQQIGIADESGGVPAADSAEAAPRAAKELTCFSVHTLEEALAEIRAHHLSPPPSAQPAPDIASTISPV